jgi:hypothetical protein
VEQYLDRTRVPAVGDLAGGGAVQEMKVVAFGAVLRGSFKPP